MVKKLKNMIAWCVFANGKECMTQIHKDKQPWQSKGKKRKPLIKQYNNPITRWGFLMTVTTRGSLDQALNRLVSSKAQHVKVGVLDGSKYPDGTGVASVAFWNEYGTKTAPARPFFRDTIKNEKSNWSALAVKSIRAGYTVEHMLNLVGMQMISDVQYTIMTFSSPPNSAYTVAKKGFQAPLRESMLLHDSIKHEVAEGML